MLETPNATASAIFPVSLLPNGDDGKRRPFHVIHCLAKGGCAATLRLSPGKGSRLPVDCVVRFAEQKGWLADRFGYALCPEHKPGGRSAMPPRQKQAAFLAIRDRDLAAAAAGLMTKRAEPVGALAKHTAKVRAAVAAAKGEPMQDNQIATDLPPAPDALCVSALERRMFAFIAAHPNRIWTTRREAARRGDFNIWTFNGFVDKGVRLGFMLQEPVAGRQNRPFRLRLVDQFDPPAMQPDQPEDSAMPAEAAEAVVVTVQPPRAEPPPSPSLEANRSIRDYLDGHFDDQARRYCGDLTDDKVAKRLGYPRAWVAAIRSALFGPDDTNEAAAKAAVDVAALEADAARLKDDALGLATRAESLERACQRFLQGRG